MTALSIDHEFLTKQGWKRNITTDDELAVFSNPIQYVRPSRVEIRHVDNDMIFIQNERVNIFGEPGVNLYNKDALVPLKECLTGVHSFTVNVSPSNGNSYTKKFTSLTDAEEYMISELLVGKHACITKVVRMNVTLDYVVTVYTTNIHFDPKDQNACTLTCHDMKGCSVRDVKMPYNQPICTRRDGKCCWVVSS